MKYSGARYVLALLLISFLVGVACTHTESASVPLAIQLNWFPDGEHAYLFYGAKLGIFKKIGVDLSIKGGRGSELSARLLAGNSVQLALASPEALLAVVAQGAEIRSLGALYLETPVVIYSLQGKGITTLESLYGKKLGVLLGSSTYVQYEGLAKKMGIQRSKIEERPVDGRTGPEMLNRGDIDALMYFEQYVDGFEAKYSKKYDRIRFDQAIRLYGMVLAVNERTVKSLGDKKIDEIRSAVIASIAEASKNPAAAISALAEKTQGLDVAEETSKLRRVLVLLGAADGRVDKVLSQSEQGWQTTNTTARDLGIVDDGELWRKLIGGHPLTH